MVRDLDIFFNQKALWRSGQYFLKYYSSTGQRSDTSRRLDERGCYIAGGVENTMSLFRGKKGLLDTYNTVLRDRVTMCL